MTTTRIIQTPDDIKTLYHATQPDGHWFDPETMRFFGTRMLTPVFSDSHGGAWFVTSERSPHYGRVYTVRYIDAEGNIDTVGEMGQYATRGVAIRVAAKAQTEASE